jgi:hypothetical protein
MIIFVTMVYLFFLVPVARWSNHLNWNLDPEPSSVLGPAQHVAAWHDLTDKIMTTLLTRKSALSTRWYPS